MMKVIVYYAKYISSRIESELCVISPYSNLLGTPFVDRLVRLLGLYR